LIPFRPGPQPYRCKGCGHQIGTEDYRHAHHCPCCAEALTGSCVGTRRPGRATCPHCGDIDTATGEFVAPKDPLADLLSGQRAPSPWDQVWREALVSFGMAVAQHLELDHADRAHVHGRITLAGKALRLRAAAPEGLRRFEAGSRCPHPACRTGWVWTTVHTRTDLQRVYLHGPGPEHSGCSRCGRAGRY
jgi:hypothetical protein